MPGSDKWRNSSTYSKSTMSTNSTDNSYSVPKPLPRRDSLRGRTKSVFQSRQAINTLDKSEVYLPHENDITVNQILPNTVDNGSSTLNRALSAPPASRTLNWCQRRWGSWRPGSWADWCQQRWRSWRPGSGPMLGTDMWWAWERWVGCETACSLT